METSLKTGFAQIFSCCPKNLSCPNFGGAAAPLARPARTPMSVSYGDFFHTLLINCCREILIFTTFLVGYFFTKTVISDKKKLCFYMQTRGKPFS